MAAPVKDPRTQHQEQTHGGCHRMPTWWSQLLLQPAAMQKRCERVQSRLGLGRPERDDAATMTEEREHTRGPACRKDRCCMWCFQYACYLQPKNDRGGMRWASCHSPVGEGTALLFLRMIWRRVAADRPSAQHQNYAGELLELFVCRIQID